MSQIQILLSWVRKPLIIYRLYVFSFSDSKNFFLRQAMHERFVALVNLEVRPSLTKKNEVIPLCRFFYSERTKFVHVYILNVSLINFYSPTQPRLWSDAGVRVRNLKPKIKKKWKEEKG
jgi:hypothetical protein